jgi:hypothetical protein
MVTRLLASCTRSSLSGISGVAAAAATGVMPI